MKANPFLSSENIFAKGLRKMSVPEEPTPGGVKQGYTNFEYGGNIPSAPSSQHNQSSQLSMGARVTSQPMMSPLTAFSEYQPSGNDYGMAHQNLVRVDSRANSTYESASAYSSYSRTISTDNYMQSATRDRAVTLNIGGNNPTPPNYDQSRLTNMSVGAMAQRKAVDYPSRTDSKFDDPAEFLESNMGMLAACLSNEQNRDEICRMIGLSSGTSSTPQAALFQKYTPIPPQNMGYEPEPPADYQNIGTRQIPFSHQQIIQPKPSQQGPFGKKLIQQEPQPNQMQPQRQPVQQQVVSHQAYPPTPLIAPPVVSPLQPLVNQTFAQPADLYQKPRLSPIPTKERSREDLSITYQSDDEDEQFDFNENRDDDQQESHHPYRKQVHAHHQAAAAKYCTIKLQPVNLTPGLSLKQSLIKQIQQCTTRNGLRTFLTAGEQFQLRQYVLR